MQGNDKFIIACRVMKPELEFVLADAEDAQAFYLDQGLHRTPNKMAPLIQEQIDQLPPHATVVLGYGLCSNGIVGVHARGEQTLIVPRCHDCISFFLGSPKAYRAHFLARPGTYYLTPGWIAEKKDPLGIVQEEYAPRFGEETAIWVMNEELKNYTHISLVQTGSSENPAIRKRAEENAAFFNKAYEEIAGSMTYFNKLVRGPYGEDEFFRIPPMVKITQEIFLAEEMDDGQN